MCNFLIWLTSAFLNDTILIRTSCFNHTTSWSFKAQFKRRTLHVPNLNAYLGRPKLLSSTVDSDGRTLHVPNLICGEKKYRPYCLKGK